MDERVGVRGRSVVVAGVSAGAPRATGRVMKRGRMMEEGESHIVTVLRVRYLAQGDFNSGFLAGLSGWLCCSG